MLASACGLSNLNAVVDYNRYQEWGRARLKDSEDTIPIADLSSKWRAFGWSVVECDGHNFESLIGSLPTIEKSSDRPSVVIAHTRKGKGIRMIEDQPRHFHCTSVSKREHEIIIESLQAK